AKKDAAVGGGVGPELCAQLEVLVRVLRDEMAAFPFVRDDNAVLGPPIGVAHPVSVIQRFGLRSVEQRDPSRVASIGHLWRAAQHREAGEKQQRRGGSRRAFHRDFLPERDFVLTY